PSFISRMTRDSSSEIGGEALLATASIAWGSDNPAFIALESRLTVSGSRELNALSLRRCRHLTYRIGIRYASTPASTNCGASPNRHSAKSAPAARNPTLIITHSDVRSL